MKTRRFISRGVLAAALLLMGAASAGAAVAHWTSAGWYVIADAWDDGWIHNGPYSSEQSCDAATPAYSKDEDIDYYCEYLASKPSWDY